MTQSDDDNLVPGQSEYSNSPVKPENACSDLIARMKTLQLATVGVDGLPHCGYTPFVHVDTATFFVFVSQLSAHTRDMLATGKAALMIIDDEQSTSQLFARMRVSYQCEVLPVSVDSSQYNDLLDQYQKRHGKMAGLLRQLPDFQLLGLHPTAGQFVMGFGQAYQLQGENLTEFVHARTG